jgi:putative transposase
MDGRGRAFDNIFVERLWRSVKYEDVYLKGYANMEELMVGMAAYIAFYNGERAHQSLAYCTPNEVFKTSAGGGAMIVDKFGGALGETPVPLRSTGVSPSTEATTRSKATAEPGQRRTAVCATETAA